MALKLFSFPQRQERQSDWTNAELAELYRVQHALAQAGVPHEVGRGVTDEGDPWFTFGSPDGEILVHITRYDGLYRLFSPALGEPLAGPTFQFLTKVFANRIPVNVRQERGSSIVMHPSALLSLIIASIFFASDFLVSGSAQARSTDEATRNSGEDSAPVDDPVVNFFAELTNPRSRETESAQELDEARRESQSNQWLLVQTAILGAAIQFEMSSIVAPASGPVEEARHVASDGASGLAVGDPEMHAEKQTSGTADRTGEGPVPPATSTPDLAALRARSPGQETSVSESEDRTVIIPDSESGPVSEAQKTPARTDDPAVAAQPTPVDSGADDQPSANIRVAGELAVTVEQAADTSLLITATGNGSLDLTAISGRHTPDLAFKDGAVEVSLEYDADGVGASIDQTLMLNGKADVTIEQIGIAGADNDRHSIEELNLNVVSNGGGANALRLNETTSPSRRLNINISGKEDVSISENVALFENTKVNAAMFSGYLNFAIDLGGDGTSHTMLAIGASNYAVTTNNSLALMNLPREVTIGIGTSLHDLVLSFEQTVPAILASAKLEFRASGDEPESISINSISTLNVPLLHIVSTGDRDGSGNRIDTIRDPELSILTISGDRDLVIDQIVGHRASDIQGITVDAHAFSAALKLDLSGSAGSVQSNQQVFFQAGSGDTAIKNLTISNKSIFVTGAGTMEIEIGRGDINDTIISLKAGDRVGFAGAAAVATITNALDLKPEQQAAIDALNSLQSAAETAAKLVDASGPEHAILFYHSKNAYIFLDHAGDGRFDASSDAIINLVGTLKISDLTNVFAV